MEKDRIVFIVIVAVVIASAMYFYAPRPEQTPVACTMEAKLCPNGSYVGRSGPKCEFAACPSVGDGAGSGIHGTLMLGPTCPVERIPPDPNCADRPYKTVIAIFHANDPVHPFAFVSSNASGTFSVSLPPGEYVLSAGESYLPRCNQTQVTVLPKIFTTTTISCDTGIR